MLRSLRQITGPHSLLFSLLLLACSTACSSVSESNTTGSAKTPSARVENSTSNTTSSPVDDQASTSRPATSTSQKSAAPAPTPVIGSGGNDFSLLASIRAALSKDPDLLNSVVVEVKDGNVVLSGKVSSSAQKARAIEMVQKVPGVKTVKNDLR
jgi:hypothetical protein